MQCKLNLQRLQKLCMFQRDYSLNFRIDFKLLYLQMDTVKTVYQLPLKTCHYLKI